MKKNSPRVSTLMERFFACISCTIDNLVPAYIGIPAILLLILASTILLISVLNNLGCDALTIALFVPLWLLCAIFSIAFAGLPKDAPTICMKLSEIGLHNHLGDTPYLLRAWREKENDRLMHYLFLNPRISLDRWTDLKSDLETVLNAPIRDILPRKGLSQMEVTAALKGSMRPDFIEWKDCFLPVDKEGEFCLALGESAFGRETIDLNLISHWLIGASTGGGKTKTLQLLLYECLCKGCQIFIGDIKFVDFSREFWQERCHIDLTREAFAETLKGIVEEMEKRQQLLLEAKCANVSEYNRTGAFPLRHIIVACDEIAELIDTGDKDEKELTKTIMGYLKSIGRIGRAFSVHLLLATQRPDADIIAGQLKSNLEGRLCGRCADSILSRVILGESTGVDASTLIPKDSRGVFVQRDGVPIQCYYLDEDSLT